MTTPPPDLVQEAVRSSEEEPLSVSRHPIPFSLLDPDAVKVVRRLSRFGHKAYLVGGCVRDIMLGRRPKDFDVATSARPAEMKRLFRNCRLIGRRFRLAHLLFKNRKVIEVATFRRTPTEEDDVSERHAAENLFGGPAEDAARRDFTVNALMYDVASKEILDWVGGLEDIERRVLRTIGDASLRLPEDPVRIVRAIKFAVRLDMTIEPDLLLEMERNAPLVAQCSPARLCEEVLKLLRSGAAARCFDLARDVGVLDELMPGLCASLREANAPWSALERADLLVARGRAISDAVLIASLLHPACAQILDGGGDVSKQLNDALPALVSPTAFTRRQMGRARQILVAQKRLARGPRTKRARTLLHREHAEEAIHLMEILAGTDEERALAKEWKRALAAARGDRRAPERGGEEGTSRPSGKRPRRRRRPRRSAQRDAPGE